MGWELRWALRTLVPIVVVGVAGGWFFGRPHERVSLIGTSSCGPLRTSIETTSSPIVWLRDDTFGPEDVITDIELQPPLPPTVHLYVTDAEHAGYGTPGLPLDDPRVLPLEGATGVADPVVVAVAPADELLELRFTEASWRINGREHRWSDPAGYVPMSIRADCGDA